MLLPAQCKAARALIGWAQKDLAKASKVAVRTVIDFEQEVRPTRERTVDDLRRALEGAGVEFIDENGGGAGVRLAKPRASRKTGGKGRKG